MLTVKHLHYSLFGDDIVRDFHLNVSLGEAVCLYGPSGCGKTTVLRIIAGLLNADSGTVHNRFRRTRYLFQEHRLLPWRTLWENVLLTAVHPDSSDTRERAKQLLQQLNLTPNDWHKYPDELSGGMRQRTALARALLDKPDLLLLDEPFSALDYELKRRLYRWLNGHIAEGMAVVMVSHDRFETLHMAHRIYLLDHKPAHCRRIVEPQGQPESRSDELIRRYLQQDFWQAHDE